MQDLNSGERYADFEQAVIETAEREASALITGAQREKAMLLRAAKNSVAESDFAKLSEAAEHWRFAAQATETQNGRRKLLLYRESLIEKLIAKVRMRLMEFADSADYEAYLSARLKANADILNGDDVKITCREKDLPLLQGLLASHENVKTEPTCDIALGGICICCGHKIYNDTIDAALDMERERFLSYCGLKVV